MRRFLITTLAAAVAVAMLIGFAGCNEQQAVTTNSAGKVTLFNGRDFTGWKLHIDDPNYTVKDVWSIHDGLIYCKGVPNGYMRTTTTYSNYQLHVEWRWPDKPANSGVFLHASGKDHVWPRCIECQLKSGSAGDFVLINHTGVTVGGKHYQSDDKMFVGVTKMAASSEKPAGQWNSYDITASGDTIEVKVNGVLQNKATDISDKSGWICLQSEGGPIEFRNVYLVPLK